MLLTFLHIIPSLFSAPDDLSVSDDLEKGVIHSITIEGVKGEGDYDLSGNKWDLSKSTAAGPYTVSFAGDEGKVEGNNRALTGGANDNKVLMMIPQPLVDGAKVTINFTPTGRGVKEASFSLGGTTWEPGRHITYVLSTTKLLNLNMGTITYPDGWKTVDKIKSTYTDGDSIGMYVVDKYNKVIVENLKFTYNDNGSQWTVESGKEFKGSPQYNYFVYYPYQPGGLLGAPAKNASNIDVTSAEKFFADAITEWGKKFDTSSGKTIDQSDIKKMNSFDLQIGKADGLGESGTTINFRSMTHAMGLAEIVLDKRSFTNRICYLVGYEEYPTWNGTTTSYASSSIKNHTMYGIADHRYVSIVEPGENSFMSNTDKDAWKEKVKLSPAANEVKSGTAYNSDNTTTPHAYTLAVGDIYYSDGAISHQEDDLISTSERIPIGIVGYTTMNGDGNYWTEKDTKEKGIGGHALVMCLKHIGSTKTSDFGYSYKWCTFDGQTSHRKLSMPEILNSFEKDYGSGYLMTKDFWLSSSYPAFQAVKNYNEGKIANVYTFPKDICTGWFIPTVGQFYAVLSQLGQYSGTFAWGVDLGSDSRDKINAALMKVGLDNYTEFFQSPTRANQVGTTTEIQTVSILVFSFESYSGSEPIFSFGTLSGPKRYEIPCKVRPFLAF